MSAFSVTKIITLIMYIVYVHKYILFFTIQMYNVS